MNQTAFAQEIDSALPAVTVSADSLEQPSEQTESYQQKSTRGPTKHNLSLRQTPQAVSVITNRQIQDFALDDVSSILESTASVTVEEIETDRTYFTSRGYEITNFQVDGVGIPLLNGNVLGDLDSAIYDRVEIVRGANGLNGATGNPSATVNSIRKRPTRNFQAAAALTLGSWQKKRAQIDVSDAVTENRRTRARVVLIAEDKNSYLDRYEKNKSVFYAVLESDIGEHGLLATGFTRQKNAADGVMWGALPLWNNDGSITDYDRSTSSATDWSFWDNVNQNYFIDYQHSFANAWQLHSSINLISSESDSELFYLSGEPDPVTGLGINPYPSAYDSEDKQVIVDIYALGPFEFAGKEHELVVGLNATNSKTEARSRYASAVQPGVPDIRDWDGAYPHPVFDGAVAGSDYEDKTTSIYSSLKYDLAEDYTMIAGLRLTNVDANGKAYGVPHEIKISNEAVPYLGLTYDINDRSTVYASYSKIFGPQREIDINRIRLDPKNGNNYELGYKSELFDSKLLFNIVLFASKQNNVAKAAGTIPGSSDRYYEAIDGVRSVGVELDVSGEVQPNLKLAAGLTLQEIEDSKGLDENTYIPREVVRLNAHYRLTAVSELSLGGSLNWQGDTYRYRTDTNSARRTQKSYALLNLVARYDYSSNVSAVFGINNVSDEKYLQSLYWGQSFYGAPRNYNLTFNYAF